MNLHPQPSPRELEVLALVAQGRTNPEIAAQLGLSWYTVRAVIRDVRRKLRARNLAHAVAIAAVRGLLKLEPDGSR